MATASSVRHGSCRWLTESPLLAFSCGGCAVLRVRRDTEEAGQNYLVRAEVQDGRTIGYHVENAAGETHYIDASFGPDVQDWRCSCKDAKYRVGGHGCRHCRGLHAALSAATK